MRRPLALSAALGLVLALLVAGSALGGIPVFDVSITKADAPDPIVAGNNLTYTIELELTNGDGHLVQVNDTLPAGTTFVSFSQPGGWTTATPALGGTGNVNATITDLLEGTYVFTLVVQVDADHPGGTLTNTVTADMEDSNGRAVPQASGSAETTVQAAPTPTPAASLASAAMAPPNPANLIATAVFGTILIGSLGALAYASVRRRARQ